MTNIKTDVQATHYPLGHIREGFEEVWGWAEVVKHSERKDPSVRWLRAKYVDEFPEPITVLANGAIFLADEIREFFRKHPKVTHRMTDEVVQQIRDLVADGHTKKAVSQMLDVHINTVLRYTK